MMDPSALDMPFDQYQRYRLVTDIIENVRTPGERLKVLDVGGRTALLRRFLPEDEVHLVDVESSEERGLVLGDGSRLPFADDSVDVLVTFDTLEHVPPARRRDFVAECARVARRWVVIAGPYQSPEVDEAERLLATFIEEKLEQEHRYLAEHATNGLPDRAETEGALASAGAEVLSIGHANLERWLALMCLALYMDRDAPLRAIASQFYRFYNAELYASDHAAPVYRHAVIGAFGGAALPDPAALLSPPAAPAGALDLSMGLVRQLMQYDVERDAVAGEFARLEGVNRDLELDLDGHKKTLVSMREVQEAQTRMIGELREQCLELRAVEEDLEAELEREREEGEEAREALAADLAGHKEVISTLEARERDLVTELTEAGEARAQAEAAREAALHEARARELESAEQARDAAELRVILESEQRLRGEEREVREELQRDLEGHRVVVAELQAELEKAHEVVRELDHAREVVRLRAEDLERQLESKSEEAQAQLARAEAAELAAAQLLEVVEQRDQQLAELADVLAAEREVIAALRRDLRDRVGNLKRAFGPKPTFGPD